MTSAGARSSLICPREKTSSYGERTTPLSLLHRSERHCSLILLNHAKLIGGLCYTLATWYIGIETYNRPWGIAAALKKVLNAPHSHQPFVASLQKSAREKWHEYFIGDMLESFDYLLFKKRNKKRIVFCFSVSNDTQFFLLIISMLLV